MQIISIGDLSKKMPEVLVECEECGTVVAVRKSDLPLPYRYVVCPICGEDIVLSEDEWNKIKGTKDR